MVGTLGTFRMQVLGERVWKMRVKEGGPGQENSRGQRKKKAGDEVGESGRGSGAGAME